MPSSRKPWDQLLANLIVKSLTKTVITPNQITIFSLILALTGSFLISLSDPFLLNLGAGLFIIARFLDHFDGELARLKNMQSKLGYYLDYVAGGISYGSLFLCLGIGFVDGFLGKWSILLGGLGALCAISSLFLNLAIDKKNKEIEVSNGESIGYPSLYGFELEDGIYLIGPITWAGWLEPFFVLAGFGAIIYTAWTFLELRHLSKIKLHNK